MRATRRPWTIRPKGERDADAVVALLAEVAREGRYIATEWPFDVEERARVMRDSLLTRHVIGWVAVADRDVIADLSLFELHRDEPELGMIVAAAHRGRGIGHALLDQAVAWARKNDKPGIRLRVFPDNERALALYRGSGFVEVELQRGAIRRSNGSALDVLVMRRAVPPKDPYAG